MLKVSIYRFNPEQDEAPYMQDYDFDTQGKDLMVLDVLGMLKSRDDESRSHNYYSGNY